MSVRIQFGLGDDAPFYTSDHVPRTGEFIRTPDGRTVEVTRVWHEVRLGYVRATPTGVGYFQGDLMSVVLWTEPGILPPPWKAKP